MSGQLPNDTSDEVILRGHNFNRPNISALAWNERSINIIGQYLSHSRFAYDRFNRLEYLRNLEEMLNSVHDSLK